jgi:hypothetical protein
MKTGRINPTPTLKAMLYTEKRKNSLDYKKGGEMEEKINGNSCLNILYFESF